jgi:molecular chaperone DnaK (HSP70)
MRTRAIWAPTLLTALVAACAWAVDDGGLRVEGAGPRVGRDGHTTETIGLETVAGVVPLLAAGCALPCSTTETFTTSADAQTHITIRLYRGAIGPTASGRVIGEFRIEGCVGGVRGTPQVALTITATGHDLQLAARDLSSNVICRIVRMLAS